RTRTFPQNLSTRIHQENVLQRVHVASYLPFHSGSNARLTSWPAFPDERSNLLRLPSSSLRPSTRLLQSRPARSEQRSEILASLFVTIFWTRTLPPCSGP